jgi:hypothetical protein
MKTFLGFLMLLALTPVAGRAQTPRKSKASTGSIEGDMYLTFMNGESKQAAGQTVFLVSGDGDVYAEVARICRGYQKDLARITDSVKKARQPLDDSIHAAEPEVQAALNAKRFPAVDILPLYARSQIAYKAQDSLQRSLREARDEELRTMIQKRAIKTTGTGMHAHFRFENIVPAFYLMYAEWEANGYKRYWLAPVRLNRGEARQRDLDSTNSGHPCELYR